MIFNFFKKNRALLQVFKRDEGLASRCEHFAFLRKIRVSLSKGLNSRLQSAGFFQHLISRVLAKKRGTRSIISSNGVNVQNLSAGFTLVEMSVAVAIFSMVVVVATGALLSIVDANQKAQSVKSIVNNVNLAVENISRSLRMGMNYHCGNSGVLDDPQDCSDGSPPGGVANDFISFFSGDVGGTVIFKLENDQIMKSIDGGVNFVGLTAPEVKLDRLAFYVDGNNSSGKEQPRVFFTVGGYIMLKEKLFTRFDLQTMVTQRFPNFK